MIYAQTTVVLKTLMDNQDTAEKLEKALSTYPMYVPQNPNTYSLIPSRSELNQKLLNHYKYREIGFETVGRFLDELKISMNEIMPYYYQLFKSADIMNGIDDVFGNVDITETFEQETTGISSGSSSGTSKGSSEMENNSETSSEMHSDSKEVSSATPQDSLSITAANMDSVQYADNASWNNSNSNSSGSNHDTSSSSNENTTSGESSSESSGTTSHTLTRRGNQGVNTYAHDMKELRETFLNIEKQIIEDERISELFMRVY